MRERVSRFDSTHTIDVFRIESDCNDLATNSTLHCHFGNKKQFINVSYVYYLLEGSEINYNISASSNSSKMDYIHFYVIEGLNKERQFDHSDEDDDDYVFSHNARIGVNGNSHFTHIHYKVKNSNYYGIKTIINRKVLVNRAEYILTVKKVFIDLNDTEKIFPNNTITSEEDPATFSLPFKYQPWCLVADIHIDEDKVSQYIHTVMHSTIEYLRVLLTIAGILLLVVLSFLAILCFICCTRCRPKQSYGYTSVASS